MLLNSNDPERFKLFKKASALGYVSASINLAESYVNGWGTPIDINMAIKIAESIYTADLNLDQKDSLGDVYSSIGNFYCFELEDTITNQKNSFKFYKKSAEIGNSLGCASLSRAYFYGDGCEVNPKLALEWAYKAEEYGGLPYRDVEITTKSLLLLGLNSDAEEEWSDYFNYFLSLNENDQHNLDVLGEYAIQVVSKKIKPIHPSEISKYLISKANQSMPAGKSTVFSNEIWKQAVFWMASLKTKRKWYDFY